MFLLFVVFLADLQECVFCFKGGMGNQGMMFGNEPVTSTQVTIPKDVSNAYVYFHCFITYFLVWYDKCIFDKKKNWT